MRVRFNCLSVTSERVFTRRNIVDKWDDDGGKLTTYDTGS